MNKIRLIHKMQLYYNKDTPEDDHHVQQYSHSNSVETIPLPNIYTCYLRWSQRLNSSVLLNFAENVEFLYMIPEFIQNPHYLS